MLGLKLTLLAPLTPSPTPRQPHPLLAERPERLKLKSCSTSGSQAAHNCPLATSSPTTEIAS